MTEEADLCIICYSELDCSGSVTYSLPECGHTFHQNCIMHWFRQANSKCPLCNNTGPFNGHPNDQRSRWNYPFERYKVLRRLSRKKDAPKDLVKGIELIKNYDKMMPAPDEAEFVVNQMKQRGILISSDGPDHNVLKIKPPLVFNRNNADYFLESFESIMSENDFKV